MSDVPHQQLAQAAEAGDVPSMARLGAELLIRGAPAEKLRGIRLIMAAAEQGEGSACAMAATLLAWGFSGQPDWPRALDHLERAAEAGFASAQDQLQRLAGKAGTDWKALRRSIDIAVWRQPPATRSLCEDPQIRAAPGLLPAEICDALIDRARPLLSPAQIYNEFRGGNTMADARRHSAAEFNLGVMDLVVLATSERLCALAGQPAVHAETSQVLHYKVGDYFRPHVDFWDPASGAHAAALAQGGQRVVTVLVYLNDNLEGGETDFPLLGVRHRGKKGDALMFRNVDASGQPDRRTVHAGLPPTSGEKWLLSLWIRDRVPAGFGDPRLAAAMEGR